MYKVVLKTKYVNYFISTAIDNDIEKQGVSEEISVHVAHYNEVFHKKSLLHNKNGVSEEIPTVHLQIMLIIDLRIQ